MANIVTNPTADQTISAFSLLPAAGNTTQSLGDAAALWNAGLGTVGAQTIRAMPRKFILRQNASQLSVQELNATGLSGIMTTFNSWPAVESELRMLGAREPATLCGSGTNLNSGKLATDCENKEHKQKLYAHEQT